MVLESYKVTAPGSLMLFGEHAVLYGKPAIVAAVDKHITVQLTPRTDRVINIVSQDYASCELMLDNFTLIPQFKFVTAAIQSKLAKIVNGFDLHITATFAPNLGLGSSAAVTVATLAVLELWLTHKKYIPQQLCSDARQVIRQIQTIGSGADVAASIFGGVIAYQMEPLHVEKIAATLPLAIVYSGNKVPTPEVVAQVTAASKRAPQTYAAIFDAMGCCVQEAVQAIKQKKYAVLGELMNIHQGLQDALGVNTANLMAIINELRSKATIYGAKISGSGMGDCVIGLGKIAANSFPETATQRSLGITQIDAIISNSGLHY